MSLEEKTREEVIINRCKITDDEYYDSLDYLAALNLILLEMANRFDNPTYTNQISVGVVMIHRTIKQMRENGYHPKNETKDKQL